jgi:hypothetical protein
VCLLGLALAACSRPPAPPPDEPFAITDAGLRRPESALHDPVADVYLVSNVNGAALAPDGNGFISRFQPDGTGLEVRWIDGASPDVTLNAPKGMVIRGDTLLVTDIDAVRLFRRSDGRSEGTWRVPGATSLIGITVDTRGTVYVTDAGLTVGPDGLVPTGGDAVFRFDSAGAPVPLVWGAALGHPYGIVAHQGRLFIVTSGTGRVIYVDPGSGQISGFPAPPAGGLEGVVVTRTGRYLVSSRAGHAVYGLSGGVRYETVVADLPGPAGIGYDATRNRVLIPLPTANRVEIRPLR